MIKINLLHSDNFLASYEEYVVTERLIPSFSGILLTASEVERERILEIFTDEFIKNLILCNADELDGKITTIYDHLHELSERYCLEYYLKDLNLDSSVTSMPIRKNIDKERIRAIHERVLTDLQLLSDERQSILFPSIIDEMQGTTVASEIKTQLTLLTSMKQGNHILSEDIQLQYSDWVKEFPNIFNYNAMSQRFGREITNSMNLDVCPYCNNEDIETINEEGAETRPDLDHYYPRSKFPFLAITLSNLIPAGGRCNQKYKKAKSMLGYVHPYIDGIDQSTLFNFNYMFDEGRNIDAIDITVNNQNNDLDKNLNLFRVQATHNKNNVKNWFLKLEERYQLLANSNPECLNETLDDDNLIRVRLDVDIQQSPTKEQYQKLKIDALNFLSDRNYEIAD
ncbi:hypothetical protein [Moritella viscosa]|uniref:Restriction endonuclease n=1 Tax=Moritella viscosa TaxID=80854 RepID=A0ABY1HJ79_9GAMM|nr:hypothetical protein [Moritella viscosa]SGZ02283.1 Putative uncharacterized protein [Moritella viscosa]SGZ15201.1 Putative uncharacterized protein [Moritella viscosa]SHO28136.1 Putative uncharacterized protein [Moritella viscosa]